MQRPFREGRSDARLLHGLERGVKDTNQNGTFEAGEYYDLDGNGQYSPGLTTIYRAGSNIPNYGKHIHDPAAGTYHTFYRLKWMPTATDYQAISLFSNLPPVETIRKNGPGVMKIHLVWEPPNTLISPNMSGPRPGSELYLRITRHALANPMVTVSKTPSETLPNGLKMLGRWTDGFGNVTFSAPVFGGSYAWSGEAVAVPWRKPDREFMVFDDFSAWNLDFPDHRTSLRQVRTVIKAEH